MGDRMNFLFRVYALIFARNIFSKFNKLLYQLSLRGLGFFNYQSMTISGETWFIKKYVLPSAVKKTKYIVFDVGANKGEYSKLISTLPNVEIHAFEPHPATFKVLQENLAMIKNIKFYNLAISDVVGRLKLFDYKNMNGSTHASLSSEIFSTIHDSSFTSHEIDVVTLDSIIESDELDSIDFLKIDVEGYELSVLKGAIKALNNKAIPLIQFEFTQLNSTTRVFFKDFYDLLADKYKIYRLLPNGLIEIKYYNPMEQEIFGYQNFVAIQNNRGA